VDDIIKEVEFLVSQGYKEVTLLGQNVNSYDSNIKYQISKIKNNFVRLLEEVDKTGIERIRFVTSHPKDAGEDLFKAMRDLACVCEHIHLPVQAGSDRILNLMNRKYNSSEYLKLIDKLRKILPDCSITTDVLVGFPTETDKDFEDTVSLMKKVAFDDAFIFKYSPRPGTKAAELVDDVPNEVKKQRNQRLLKLQRDISTAKNRKRKGEIFEVLVDGIKGDGLLLGKTRGRQTVLFKGDNSLFGRLVLVKITETGEHSLKGEIIR
jgi:tRNA-2-methylthio-N6-dimethylallyladenosine synthase